MFLASKSLFEFQKYLKMCIAGLEKIFINDQTLFTMYKLLALYCTKYTTFQLYRNLYLNVL